MDWDLPLIWAGVIGTAVALYVILDGFDLGVGILFPFSAAKKNATYFLPSSDAGAASCDCGLITAQP